MLSVFVKLDELELAFLLTAIDGIFFPTFSTIAEGFYYATQWKYVNDFCRLSNWM